MLGAEDMAMDKLDPIPPFIKLIVKYLNSEPMLALLLNQLPLGLLLTIRFPTRAELVSEYGWSRDLQIETSSRSPPWSR